MKIENINKSMPYIEDEGYVTSIVSQATENAIHNTHSKHWYVSFARIAASVAIIAGIGYSGWIYMKHKEAQAKPLDTFLSNISDEEAEMLEYFYVEDLYLEED